MKKMLIQVLTLILIPVLLSGPAFAAEETAAFADVSADSWYHEAVEFVVDRGIMSGFSDTKFSPESTLTRAQVVTVLWRLDGSPVVNYAMSFSDVPQDQWYSEAVRWAASEKVVTGYANGSFGCEDPVTREQLITILWRYAQAKGYDLSVGDDTNILSYLDAFEIAEYAVPAMQWACGDGVISGNGTALKPKDSSTRCEFAKIMMGFCQNTMQ